MTDLFVGSMLLVAFLGLTELVTRFLVFLANRNDQNRTREFRRVVMLAEAEALQAATRNKRNHRQPSAWGSRG